MASKYVKVFLASEQAAFKVFLDEIKESELDLNELQSELSKHCDELRGALDSLRPRRPSPPILATPARKATTSRPTVPTRTSSGRVLRVGGAGTVFRTGSGTKRRRTPDSDSPSEASVARTTIDDDSPTPRKKRLVPAGQMNKIEEGGASVAGEAVANHNLDDDRPRYQGTARRTGSGTKKRVIDSPFINH